MNQPPEPAHQNNARRDGFAALAAFLLAAGLIFMAIHHFV